MPSLFLLDETNSFVDGHVRLALRVCIDRVDLVALDATLAVEMVDHDFGTERVQARATGGERAGVVVNHADLDFLVCGNGGEGRRTESNRENHDHERRSN